MAHLFESGFFVGEAPWHGLGNIVPADTRYNVADGIIAAGLNWDVYTRNCGYQTTAGFHTPMEDMTDKKGEKVGERPLKMFTCRRMLTPLEDGTTKEEEQVLGCVGGTYEVVQNADIFNWFQPYLESGEASLHTAGSLNKGRWVWALAKLNRPAVEIVPGDFVEKFLLLSSSHDGTQALRIGFTPIRVVCANTLSLAVNDKRSNLLRLKHTKMIQVSLNEIHDIVNLMDQGFEATAEQFRLLASRKVVNRNDLEKYVIKVMTNKEPEWEDGKWKLTTNMRNIIFGGENARLGIIDRITSQSNSMPGVDGTWWGAYNALTEHLTWASGGQGGAKTSPLEKANNRLSSLWFGKNLDLNQTALSLAIEMSA